MMTINIISGKKERYMNELNQNLAENLGLFLLGLKDEVIKGLQDYMRLSGLSFEAV